MGGFGALEGPGMRGAHRIAVLYGLDVARLARPGS